MEISLNNIQAPAPATNNNLVGVAAPQTEAQRSDQSVQRVVANNEAAALENKASNPDQTRFDAIRAKATQYVDGANPYLKDIKYTVYRGANYGPTSAQYVVRFTSLDTGKVEVRTEQQLFSGESGGSLVSGQI